MNPFKNVIWNRKIDLIEGHYVSVICTDGRTYKGFGAGACIGGDEDGDGEDDDAVRLDLDDGHFVILTEVEIDSYEILD